MNKDRPTFEQLCHAVLEGSASEADLEQFREMLRNSVADREAYYQQMQIHALLIWQNGRAAVPESLVLAPMDYPPPPNTIPFPLNKLIPFRMAVLAAAAALALLLGLAFLLVPDRDQHQNPVYRDAGLLPPGYPTLPAACNRPARRVPPLPCRHCHRRRHGSR